LIRFVKYADIEKSRWDRCIEKAINGKVYGYSWYLDIVCREWNALIEDDYIAVFPLPSGRKFFIDYIYQPFFTQQLGVFSRNHLTSAVVREFIDCLPKRYKYLDINLNTLNKPDDLNCRLLPQLNHELDLIFPYSDLVQKFSQNTRRNLGRALKSGISLSSLPAPAEIVRLFRQNRGKDLTHLTNNEYIILIRLIDACLSRGIAEVIGAYTHHNELCAGAIFIRSHEKAIFLFSAVNAEARTNGAMSLIINEFIRQNAGCQLTLDFEGSNDPDLARYYKSFGATALTYQRIIISKMPHVMTMALMLLRRIQGRSAP
jgi:hypothetical protein